MNKRLIGVLLTVLLCVFAVFGLGESVSSEEKITAEGPTERASFYTITYDANGGYSYSVPSKQAVTPGGTIKLSSSTPTREMYTFLGWSKNKSATAATYLPGSNITPSDSIVLYAIWEKAKSIGTISADKSMKLNNTMEGLERWYEFTVGSTGNYMFSAIRSDGNQNDNYYDVDVGLYEYVTNNGSSYLSQIGWHTIGSSSSYQENSWTIELKKGSKYYLPIHVNWNDEKEKEVQITLRIKTNIKAITYDVNGGYKYSVPSKQAVTPGETIKLSSSTPTREMYTFLGWSKNKSATAATYLPGSSITPSDSIVLYAIWEKARSIGTISADKSMKLNNTMEGLERWYEFTVGSTGNYMFSAIRSDGNQNDNYYDVDVGLYEYVTSNGSSYLSQIGWHTIGSSTSYQENSWTIELKKGSKYYLPIHVNWNDEKEKEVQITLRIKTNIKTITYDVNGGYKYSVPPKQAVTPGETIKLSSSTPTREMYTFLGWSKNKSATAATYLPGSSITPSDSIVLYAIWEKARSIGTISADKSMKLNNTMEGLERWYEFTVGSTGNYMFSANRSDGNPNEDYYDVDAGLYEYVTNNGSSYLSQIGWHTIGSSTSYQENSWTIELKKGSKYYLPIRVSWNSNIDQSVSVRLFIGVPSTGANARTVTYDANGGTLGSVPAKQTVEANKAAELSWEVPYREHYNFLGWSKSKTAESADYLPAGSFTTGSNTTLYAVWKPEGNMGTLLMEKKRKETCTIPQAERWIAFRTDCDGPYTVTIRAAAESTFVKAALFDGTEELESVTIRDAAAGGKLEAWLDAGKTYSLRLKPYWYNGQNAAFDLTFGIPRMTSRLVLPFNLREIRERAYAGTEFGSIVIPEGVETVGPYAFADCAELTKIIVLSADTDFADTAFEGCAGLTFVAPTGSTAQAFAGAHGYSFEAYVP